MRNSLLALCCLAALTAPANAQINVAIAGSEHGLYGPCALTDIQSYLVGTGAFASVDIVDVNGSTPSLATLLAYDAVITWSRSNYSSPVAMGDVLADYVDAGGGVVVSPFANSSTSTGNYLQGRWQSGGYEVVPAAAGTTTGLATLGTVLNPGHPVMQGVGSFSGGVGSFRPTTTALTPGSTLIAQWSDGKTLVAEGATPQRIDLGFSPPSNNCPEYSSFWDATTDGAKLVANALTYVAGGGVYSGAYCFGDGTGLVCPCGNPGGNGEGCGNSGGAGAVLGASGSAAAATDNLVLEATGLLPGQPGLLFVGLNAVNGGAGLPFGDGLRCAWGGVVRIGARVPNSAGEASWGPGLAPLGGWQAGDVRRFQVWYRDPAFFGCVGFNLTNGLEVAFY